MALEEDQRGYMWFGTQDGLNRFDGYQIKIFRNIPGDTTSLVDNYVTSLELDESGTLWVGTQEGGLHRYNSTYENFVRISLRDLTKTRNEPGITHIATDSLGQLWLATDSHGLIRYDPATGAEKVVWQPLSSSPTDFAQGLRAVLVDNAGNIWTGTDTGELYVKKRDLEAFHSVPFQKEKDGPGVPHLIDDIFQDSRNQIWIATDVGAGQVDSSLSSYRFAIFDTTREVTSFAEDSLGAIWIGTSSAGAVQLDPATGETHVHSPEGTDPGALDVSGIFDIHISSEQIVWFAMNGTGIYFFDPSPPFKLYQHLDYSQDSPRFKGMGSYSVRSMYEDGDSLLWVGSYGGFTRINLTTGDISPVDLVIAPVYTMAKGPYGFLWLGSEGTGVFRLNPRTMESIRYTHDPTDSTSLADDFVFEFCLDSKNRLWIGTQNGISVWKIHKDKSELSDVTPDELKTILLNKQIYAITETSDGHIWIGTEKSGLIVYSPRDESYHRFIHVPGKSHALSSNMIKCIFQDTEGTIWIGTMGGGLNRYVPERMEFEHFDTRHGLPNNVIYGILEDPQGNLWLSTNYGIARFTPVTGDVLTFDVTDGLQGNEFNTSAFHFGGSGTMYFGGIRGLTAFRPSDIRPQEYVPSVVINELRIGNERVPIGPDDDGRTILTQSITETDSLQLEWTDKVVGFKFAGISFNRPEGIEYRYQLEGFDPQWIKATALGRTAVYSNLPPGKYTFRVSARAKHGRWSQQPKELFIQMAPPPWRSWWAYSIYVAILGGILFAVRRYERRQDDYKHQIVLEKKEREKQAEVAQAKNEFLANVSHEFRTPLTLIKGNIEDLSTELETTYGKTIDVLQRNLGRLEYLIDRLLEIPRLESYSESLDLENMNFSAFLRRQTGDFQSLCEAAGIDLQLSIPEAPVMCRFDPEKMQMVIANLLSNAYKFTGRGGTITVSLEKSAGFEHRSSLLVTIQDTGVGISPDDLNRIFEKYYQVKGDDDSPHKGLGIGLSLVKELVGLHGGTITAKSEPGHGTRMQLRLPLVPVGSILENSAESKWAQNEEATKADGPLFPVESPVEAPLLLLIEDNQDLQDYLYKHLSGDFRVHQAYDGKSGLQKAEELVPDLIVSDVMMPMKDGFSVVKEIRQNPVLSHIPTILLTARSSEQDILKGLEHLADIYLVKPFKVKQLRAHIFNLLENRALVANRYAETWYETPDTAEISSEDQAFMGTVRNLVSENIDNPDFSVQDMAEALFIGRRQLERKIKSLTNKSPGQLLKTVRMQTAKGMLSKGQFTTVQEVAQAVGYANPDYFSRLFKKEFDVPPSEIKQKP